MVYDYGAGGVWAFLRASSEAEVRARYPQLEIVKERPNWMTDDQEQRVRERMTIDTDDGASGFLEALNRGGPPDAEQGA